MIQTVLCESPDSRKSIPLVVTKPKRKSVGTRLRYEIFSRDNFTCLYCGKKGLESKLHIDHIVPVSKGGSSLKSNLITSCAECNLGKSNKINIVPLYIQDPYSYYIAKLNGDSDKINVLVEESTTAIETEFYNWLGDNDVCDDGVAEVQYYYDCEIEKSKAERERERLKHEKWKKNTFIPHCRKMLKIYKALKPIDANDAEYIRNMIESIELNISGENDARLKELDDIFWKRQMAEMDRQCSLWKIHG